MLALVERDAGCVLTRALLLQCVLLQWDCGTAFVPLPAAATRSNIVSAMHSRTLKLRHTARVRPPDGLPVAPDGPRSLLPLLPQALHCCCQLAHLALQPHHAGGQAQAVRGSLVGGQGPGGHQGSKGGVRGPTIVAA